MTGLRADAAFIACVIGYAILAGACIVLALGPLLVLARIALG